MPNEPWSRNSCIFIKATLILHLGKRKQDQNFSKIADFEGLENIKGILILNYLKFPDKIAHNSHTLNRTHKGP